MKKGEICIKKWQRRRFWMWFVDLNYSFECDWLIELSDNKLFDNKLSDYKLSKTTWQVNQWEIRVFKPITIEEIVMFMIK